MTLSRYLLMGFIRATLGVFAVLALIVALFAGVDDLRRYAGSDAELGDILRLTALGMPETLYEIFPLILMLSSLALFLKLSRTSELVVMRAAGISALRLIAVPALAAILLGYLSIAMVNPFVAATLREAEELEGDMDNDRASFLSFSSEGIWLRQADADGQTVIQAARSNITGTILTRVTMHRFDERGTLYSRIEAPVARLTSGAWRIDVANVWEAAPDGRFEKIVSQSRYDLPTTLTTEQILESFTAPEMIGFWDLPGFIDDIENAGFSGQRHRLFFQSELARPALFAAMVLIGAIFSLRPQRFGQTGVMILVAILAGFALYFFKDFAETLGAQGQIPMFVSVWAAPLSAILFALGLLLHLEDG
ncbi:LPS export ABC transporter permease LptG [Amaricoccus macauensis]|uniref:LPS export ABC transporter permease LptG n=1 Tax=Amaricoccus macauensis TaxID=57001 RepID=UPI003C7CFC97